MSKIHLSRFQTITVIRYGIGRLKAYCDRGSIIVDWNDALMFDGNAKLACEKLVEKFAKEDVKRYGKESRSWDVYYFIGGQVKNSYVFVNAEGF